MTAAAQSEPGRFGKLSPMLSPRSIAVFGASNRDGNLGGIGLRFLRQFNYPGALYPVNASQPEVAGLSCIADLSEAPGPIDLAIIALPAPAVTDAIRACGRQGVPAAIVWSAGFAEAGPEGVVRQVELVRASREAGVMLCGPNSVGIINTSLGLTATFSNLFHGQNVLLPGAVSLVSQSGGVSVNVLQRARLAGYGMRVTVSVGNEAGLTLADFMQSLAVDSGTRILAVYAEGLADADGFVEALRLAREREKPVVILKGGASEASGRAALAHTGRLAGSDRTFDAILQEFAAIRVRSTEEMIDVCGQLAALAPGVLPRNDRAMISTFGGGVGVTSTDQCVAAGLSVPTFPAERQRLLAPSLSPLSSCANPVDMTPGVMTDPKLRVRLPDAFATMADEPDCGAWLFMSSGFGSLAPQLVEMLCAARERTSKPILVTWQSMPEGIPELLAERGFFVFQDSARAVRVLEHLVRFARALGEPVRCAVDTGESQTAPETTTSWPIPARPAVLPLVLSEPQVAGLLEAAGLPVAPGRFVPAGQDPVLAAEALGFPVALKGISDRVTHRHAAGLVALHLDSGDAVSKAVRRFGEIEAALGLSLEGLWVQTMQSGQHEFMVTAFRDTQFGLIVGLGLGGVQTELLDDFVFARAPVAPPYASAMVGRLRCLRRFPNLLTEPQVARLSDFVSRFSHWIESVPWDRFTIEINPVKVGTDGLAAVDGLIVIESLNLS
jgi:acyl-CoA synthetase (NDP forming)